MQFVFIQPDNEEHLQVTYQILRERYEAEHVNIPAITAATELPTFEEHRKYWLGIPYLAPFLFKVKDHDEFVGALFLGSDHELSIYVLNKFRGHGYGRQAIADFIRLHEPIHLKATVNINNEPSKAAYESLGWKPVAYIYSYLGEPTDG